MVKSTNARLQVVANALFCLLALSPGSLGQTPPRQPSESPPQDQSEVVRVYTDLVQTDVTVFDKQGNFVNGLRREDFEFKIDGKVRPIEFFEQVKVGSPNEETQLSAARGTLSSNKGPGSPAPLDRERTIFFFVDDLHLRPGSLKATQRLMNEFIDKEMSQNDEAAIASSSGQIGFLQQLTANKSVLHAALQRIKPRSYSAQDFDRPPMTQYQALLISNLDREVTDFFVLETLRQNPGISRDMANHMVKARASMVSQQAANITRNTLIGLESLVRSSSKLPGRKVVFFISDGFFLESRVFDSMDKVQTITSAAARSGVVIYSFDARGLVASLTDASTEGQIDLSGTLQRASSGELHASQDSLNALARDTGGRAVLNTNDLKPGLKTALKETAVYYLLAWKPDAGTKGAGRFRRIEVKLVGKPDLTVRVRRGFFDVESEPLATKATNKAKDSKPAEKTPEAKLREVISAPFPVRSIPLSISLTYVNTTDKGGLLSTSVQIPSEFLTFSPDAGKTKSVVEIAGAIYNDHGQPGPRFSDRITITGPSTEIATPQGNDFSYKFPVHIAPGLYQVRVGARDVTSGKAGSAHEWIQIPDLSSGELAMSSLLIGERAQGATTNASAGGQIPDDQVNLSIDHRFRSGSYLRFLVFVYNATRAASDSQPDVALQLQLMRDDQPVVTTSQKKVTTEGIPDLKHLPYAAEISLKDLSPGRYLFRVTVVDRISKRSASRETRIEIE